MLPRQILPGSTLLITRSTSEQRLFMTPKKEVNRAIRYCLAIAAQRSGVNIHAVVFLSNHYHILLTDPEGLLPLFTEELNKLLARCLNAYLGRRENFWAGSVPTNYVRLADDDAIIRKLAYLVANPVESRLVKFSRDWPGVLLWKPGTYQAQRPDFFFRKNGPLPEHAQLTLTTPPIAANGDECAAGILEAAVNDREKMLRREHRASRRSYLGARAVVAQEWWSTPSTAGSRDRQNSIAPSFATRSPALRSRLVAQLRAFVDDYRLAFLAWRSGIRDVVFPVGTYRMRFVHKVACASSP